MLTIENGQFGGRLLSVEKRKYHSLIEVLESTASLKIDLPSAPDNREQKAYNPTFNHSGI
jgi:hypothetical protein